MDEPGEVDSAHGSYIERDEDGDEEVNMIIHTYDAPADTHAAKDELADNVEIIEMDTDLD